MKEEELEQLALEAKGDPRALEKLVALNEGLLLRTAAAASQKYISKSDDEWSVALAALYEAVEAFQPDRGSFHALADMVIRRRLLDYRRSQCRYAGEISVSPGAFDGDPGEDGDEEFPLRLEVAGRAASREQEELRTEILSITPVFATYGFFSSTWRDPPQRRKRPGTPVPGLWAGCFGIRRNKGKCGPRGSFR